MIKKVQKIFSVSSTIAMSLLLLFNASYARELYETRNISNIDQYNYLAQKLEADTSYTKFNDKEIIRMKHNNGEPIYCYLSEEFSQEEQKSIRAALEHVFGIIGRVNPYYQYKIVDKKEIVKQTMLDKTTITFGYYSKEVLGDVAGLGDSVKAYANQNFSLTGELNESKKNRRHFDIRFIKEEMAEDEWDRVSLHELLHTFGINDVYNYGQHKKTDKVYANTSINILYKYNFITPNDFDVLISAYSEAEKNTNKDVQKLKELSKAYERWYYSKIIDSEKQNGTITSDEKMVGQNYSNNFKSSILNSDGSTSEEQVITVKLNKNNKYRIEVKHSNYDYVDFCEGDVIYIKGVAVLKDVKLNKRIPIYSQKDVNYIGDLYLFRNNNRDHLYEMDINYVNYTEKAIEQENIK